MNSKSWQKVEELLNEALEIEPQKRRKFLADIEAKDLRREVESLLDGEAEAENFLAAPVPAFSADFFADDAPDALIGQMIGNYKIVGELGRGGMGAVYLGERSDGKFSQKVAVKLLKRELNTADIRRRFARERQILAALAHPNIARLLDAGTTADGLPFLVMEFVEGLPIDEFCDIENSDLNARLELFRTICEAVAFAHRNLIVHRDLKPSNILVTKDGIPKLLDFGISKLLTSEFEAETAHTVTKLGAMTPEYASPEQVRGESVTTATDVYSLGVILYELLTSQRPFELKKYSVDEIIRAVCEAEPIPPSAALYVKRETGNARSKTFLQTDRQTNTKRNNNKTVSHSSIRIPRSGDLDNIVLMALKKDAHRRYSTVEQFSEDIRRHLTNLPVAARPDTISYRAAKFINRNRLAVFASLLIFLTLIGGIAATVWQARRAEANRVKSELAAEKQKKITGFMERVLSYANPSWYAEGGKFKGQARVIDVLNELSGKIETEFADDLEIQAELHHKCAEIFLANRLIDRARTHAVRALELRRQVFGERHPEVAKDLYYLGEVLSTFGNYAEQKKLLEQSAAIFRETAPDNANLPYLLESLGDLKLRIDEDYDASEKLFAESLEIFRRRDGEIHFNTARLYLRLSIVAARRGDPARAEELFRTGESRIAQIPSKKQLLTTLLFRGLMEDANGNFSAAETAFQQLIEAEDANSGDVINARGELIMIYERRKDWTKAAEVGRLQLEDAKIRMPQTSVGFGKHLIRLSVNLLRSGSKSAEAGQTFERAFQIFLSNRKEAETAPDFLLDIGESLLFLNRRAEAVPILEEMRGIYRANYPPNFYARIRAEKLLE